MLPVVAFVCLLNRFTKMNTTMGIEDGFVDNEFISFGFSKEYWVDDTVVLVIYRKREKDFSLEVTCSYEESKGTFVLADGVIKSECWKTKQFCFTIAGISKLHDLIRSLHLMGLTQHVVSELNLRKQPVLQRVN
jgi:hypothetical protein